jgi:hypothetical protein
MPVIASAKPIKKLSFGLSAFFVKRENIPQKKGDVAKITLTFAAFVYCRATISRKK